MKRQAKKIVIGPPKLAHLDYFLKISTPKYFSSLCSDFFTEKLQVYASSPHQSMTVKFHNMPQKWHNWTTPKKTIALIIFVNQEVIFYLKLFLVYIYCTKEKSSKKSFSRTPKTGIFGPFCNMCNPQIF